MALPSCSSLSPSDILISPQPASVPVGQTVAFTATTASITGTVTWDIADTSGIGGTFSPTHGSAVTYTAPSAPPVYLPITYPQGTVLIEASATLSTGCPAYKSESFTITAPSITTGLTPTTASVALGTFQSFSGWAVGNLNGQVAWQVNGVTGGSTTYGTITTAGTPVTYFAPTVMPMTGPIVTITLVSQVDPTKTASAVITLH